MAEAATQTNSSNTNPDAALLIGGPAGEHGKVMPKDGEPHPETKTKAETKQEVKFELNGKTFQSLEDMSKYVADLETKVISQPQQNQQQQPQPQNTKVVIDGMTLEQLMFANPERYHQYVLGEATKIVDSKVSQVENRKTFWSDFYTNNPDLRGKEELVDAVVAKSWTNNWEKLPLKDFAKVAADQSRLLVKKVGGNVTEVPRAESAALGTSGPSAPQVEVPRKETSFVEELKNRHKKAK
jgi:hypothetical protein